MYYVEVNHTKQCTAIGNKIMKETGAISGKFKKEIPSEAQREKDYTMHNGQKMKHKMKHKMQELRRDEKLDEDQGRKNFH